MFRPQVNQRLRIGRHEYRFLPHPMSPAFPYGQEGRMAVVYKLIRETSGTASDAGVHRAFKVFKSAYRTPQIELKAREIKAFASLPGLQACIRRVISPNSPRYRDLLQQYPDLAYAVLMPWVPGETWGDIMLRQKPLTRDQAWTLAWSVLYILVEMERRNMAHCDLAASNLMVDWHDNQPVVALVDVEQIYAPGLSSPESLLVGSPGYMPHFDRESLWGPLGDRFAGAVLLAEILAWYHPEVARHGNEQSYFREEEMHTESERFRLLVRALEGWGKVFGELFRRAWFASSLQGCPPLSYWYDAFQGRPVNLRALQSTAAPSSPSSPPSFVEHKAPFTETEGTPAEESMRAEPDEPVSEMALGKDTEKATREMDSPVISAESGETTLLWEQTGKGAQMATEGATEANTGLTEPEVEALEDAETKINTELAETTVEVLEDEEEHTRMMDLETTPEGPTTATMTESAPPEERVHVLWNRARKRTQLGLVDQALEAYRQAIDLAVAHRLPQLETLLTEHNNLLFQRLRVLQQGLYRRAALERTQVRSLSAAQRIGYWLGGLSQGQLALVLGGVAATALVLMALLSPLVRHPFWASLSLGTLLLALLLPSFQRSPVVTGVYVVAVFFGFLGIYLVSPERPALFLPLLIAAIGSWLASWSIEIMNLRLPKDWLLHMLWSTGASLLVGMLIDETAYPGSLGKFNDPNAWIFNPLLAFTGWYIGYQIRELLLAFREAASQGGRI